MTLDNISFCISTNESYPNNNLNLLIKSIICQNIDFYIEKKDKNVIY